MNVDNFRELYIAELQELRSVESQLVDALPKMVQAAEHPDLKQALQAHLEETRTHRERIDGLLRQQGVDPREHEDQSMQAIVREADKWASMVQDPDLRDAGLVASAQRVEHYEIAVYGTLTTWAKQLGFEEDQRVLHAILDEEKHADETLTGIAKLTVNPEAAHA
jgi:ferritin-like metal-binding protein YciE